jgi:ABC-2 type transport system permease protein
MRKIWTIAAREYRATIRTKTFLIAVILMPVFMGGGLGMHALTEGKIDTETKRIGVVDRSGKMFSALEQAVERHNTVEIFDEDSHRPTGPKYSLENIPLQPDSDGQLLALSERVNKKELFAFVEVGAKVLEGGVEGTPSPETTIRYFSNQPTFDEIRRWLSRSVSERVQSVRLKEAGLDRTVVEKAMQPVDVESLGLFTRDENGRVKQAVRVNQGIAFGVPFGLVMLMFIGIMMTTQPMLLGVLEEKMHRVSEVLLGSVRPFELMFGKLLGFVGVATTLVGLYMTGGLMVAKHYGFDHLVSTQLLFWFIVFQSLAIFMYGALFMACGACCNDTREAHNLVLPLMLPLMIPLFVLGQVLEHPNSNFATWLSFFPPATPMLMIMLMAIPPGVAPWQPIVGIIGVILTMLACIWAAGRVFRVGLLMQGKPPKLTDLVKWVVRG